MPKPVDKAPTSDRAGSTPKPFRRRGGVCRPIIQRIDAPSPDEVRAARKAAGLTQADAALLVTDATYRSWQNYETRPGSSNANRIPLAVWELFLLMTDQHPGLTLHRRKKKRPK